MAFFRYALSVCVVCVGVSVCVVKCERNGWMEVYQNHPTLYWFLEWLLSPSFGGILDFKTKMSLSILGALDEIQFSFFH